MDKENRQKELRTIGIYVLVILALARLLVYPLHQAVAEKKLLLDERYNSYKMQYQLLERQRGEQGGKMVVDKDVISRYLYDKRERVSHIQADVLENFIKMADKKGVNILDFEVLEPVAGKNVSEVPVLVRLEGKPLECIDILKAVEQWDKALKVKSVEINRAGQGLRLFLTMNAFRAEK